MGQLRVNLEIELQLAARTFVGVNSAAIFGSNFHASRIHVHHVGKDAFKTIWNATIERCYVHHIGMNPGVHADCNQTREGGNIYMLANNFDVPSPVTASGDPNHASNSASINQAKAGDIDGLVMEGNWLNGGNYTVFFETSDAYHPNLVFTGAALINNRFGNDYQFGPLKLSGPTFESLGFLATHCGKPGLKRN